MNLVVEKALELISESEGSKNKIFFEKFFLTKELGFIFFFHPSCRKIKKNGFYSFKSYHMKRDKMNGLARELLLFSQNTFKS